MESVSTHRFAPNTAENSSGQLWIASILCLIYCTLVLVVRLHIKWRLYGVDDAAVTIATALQLGVNIPVFIALQNGLGDSTLELNRTREGIMGKATFAAQLFFILALAASKLSVTALMLRLFTRDIVVTRKARILCYTTIAITILWALGSIIGMALSCSPSDFVRDGGPNHCRTRLLQWWMTAAFDIVTELLLVILPTLFVWSIRMKRHIKTQVAIAFGFRLPLVAIAAVHLYYVSKYSNATNMSRSIIPALVLQQCELLWSLISATIPTLKKFMRTFNSGFGMEIDLDSPYGHRSGPDDDKTYILGSGQRSEGFILPINPNANAHKHQEVIASDETPRSQGNRYYHEVSEPNETSSRPQSGYTSHSSRDMIIKREVGWRISYEDQKRPKT
ncbi:CFEM domain-containing protein [Stagonosporopsis vannaccii]|nr:CFEM domain-containing protein [Stagonosporopsis vannaccii]